MILLSMSQRNTYFVFPMRWAADCCVEVFEVKEASNKYALTGLT